jgi:Protein of unknown function (DUF3667)
MSGEIDAAGDVVTGALVARAIEEQGEPGSDGHTHERACLNCATPLQGAYCHACGQHAHIHRTLGALGHDLLHGVLHFEGKVWRTLPLLAWNPGALTRRYIHGERVRFVSPLALFLFSVFLMFAVFGSIGGPFGAGRVNFDPAAAGNIGVAEKQQRTKIAGLEAKRRAVAAGAAAAKLDAQVIEARRELAAIQTARALAEGTSGGVITDRLNIDFGSRELDARVREALSDPKLLLYKLQNSAYKFAWALIPLSLPFMWLVFAWRRGFRMYDHAVFVTYSLSAVILLGVAMALLAAVGIGVEWALFLVPVHFFWQLRGAYGLGIFSALWRTIALLAFSALALSLFGVGLLALGLLG